MSFTRFPTRFGRYILLDRVSSGGMAEVFRAKYSGAENFQRIIAIKRMLPQLAQDETFATMFIDEAKLAAKLTHPNIVPILELGRIETQLYIAMDLVVGRDLRHIIRRSGKTGEKIPLAFAAYVIARAAEGLDFAHRFIDPNGSPLNLVHRDVSPQNILVAYDGAVKVADFGIAKAEARATETQAGILKGKLAYMAPEQAGGRAVDQRADIFALGTVLYETVAGKKLFEGESDLSILDKVTHVAVPPMTSLLPDSPVVLQEVLATALAMRPEDRYPHASDLAEALAPLLIDDRSIFGTKQAGEWMKNFYAAEISTWSTQLQQYLSITEKDCVDQENSTPEAASAQVFAAHHSRVGPSPARPAGPQAASGSQVRAAPQAASGSQVRAAPQAASGSQVRAAPQAASGSQVRAMSAAQSAPPAQAEQPAPTAALEKAGESAPGELGDETTPRDGVPVPSEARQRATSQIAMMPMAPAVWPKRLTIAAATTALLMSGAALWVTLHGRHGEPVPVAVSPNAPEERPAASPAAAPGLHDGVVPTGSPRTDCGARSGCCTACFPRTGRSPCAGCSPHAGCSPCAGRSPHAGCAPCGRAKRRDRQEKATPWCQRLCFHSRQRRGLRADLCRRRSGGRISIDQSPDQAGPAYREGGGLELG